MSAPGQSTGGPPEAQLLDYVHQLERSYFEWRVAYLHLSRLRPNNRRDYQLRVAASEFEPLLERHHGHLFRLTDGDMVVFCKGASVAEIDEAVLRLRYLFSDDPLLSDARPPDDDGGAARRGSPRPGCAPGTTWRRTTTPSATPARTCSPP